MEKKKNEILVDKHFLCELCGFLDGLYSFIGAPIYKEYSDRITKFIDDSEVIEKEMETANKFVPEKDSLKESLKEYLNGMSRDALGFYIDNIVHYIYDTYDGDEFEIYTLAYANMCVNKINDRECILACFVDAIISVVGGEFNDVYENLVKHINRRG